MSLLNSDTLLQTLKKLIIKANTDIRPDVKEAITKAKELEENQNAKKVLEVLLENATIASKEKLPICQDTGYVDIYFELPFSNVILSDSEESGDPSASPQDDPSYLIGGVNLQAIADEAVRQVYSEQNYRYSVVADPLFERKNTGDNTPVNINIIETKNEKPKVSVLIKGAGSDNSSAIFMLNPSSSRQDFIDLAVKHIKENAAKSCPPLVIGIGIGSSFDKVASLSKKALLRPIRGERRDLPASLVVNQRRQAGVRGEGLEEKYIGLEQEILEQINNLGIGPSALGGKTTALAVKIEQAPCHMATLPLAINLNCYALRSASVLIGGAK